MASIKQLQKEIIELKKLIKKSSIYRKRVYTIKEASIVAGVSISYIQKLVAKNQIPYSRPTGKIIFIKRRDLESFLMSNYVLSKEQISERASETLRKIKENRF